MLCRGCVASGRSDVDPGLPQDAPSPLRGSGHGGSPVRGGERHPFELTLHILPSGPAPRDWAAAVGFPEAASHQGFPRTRWLQRQRNPCRPTRRRNLHGRSPSPGAPARLSWTWARKDRKAKKFAFTGSQRWRESAGCPTRKRDSPCHRPPLRPCCPVAKAVLRHIVLAARRDPAAPAVRSRRPVPALPPLPGRMGIRTHCGDPGVRPVRLRPAGRAHRHWIAVRPHRTASGTDRFAPGGVAAMVVFTEATELGWLLVARGIQSRATECRDGRHRGRPDRFAALTQAAPGPPGGRHLHPAGNSADGAGEEGFADEVGLGDDAAVRLDVRGRASSRAGPGVQEPASGGVDGVEKDAGGGTGLFPARRQQGI